MCEPERKDCRRLRAVAERVYNEEFLTGGKNPYHVQVISPLRSKTEALVDELNVSLQRIANPEISEEDQLTFGKVIFRKGDRVMQVSNNYDKGVFNGDTGFISLVSKAKKRLQVDYKGLKVEYSESEFEQLKLFAKDFSLVGFNLAQRFIELGLPQEFTAYGYLKSNCYRGKITKELSLLDLCA